MIEHINPADIEKKSFEIIGSLLGDRLLDPEKEPVIKRVIHTTADFDYVDNLVFSEGAVAKGIEALKNGCDIVTDTQMARSGINKTILGRLGGHVHCFMSDPDVAASAAYILELEIVLMTVNGRRGHGLLAVVEAHVDKAHALPREMRLKDILILLVVNDTHFSHLLSRILIFIYILP